MKKRVAVWGHQVEVEVYHRSKTVWIASGEYKGKYYECKAHTPGPLRRHGPKQRAITTTEWVRPIAAPGESYMVRKSPIASALCMCVNVDMEVNYTE